MASLADKKKALDWSNRNAQGFQGILDVNQFLPVTGDVQSGILAGQDLQQGNYGSAALNAVGLLPFVPSLGGTIKKINKSPIDSLLSGDVKVYHGTDEIFDKFDLSKFGKTDEGFAGKGIYFTNNPEIASEYGKNVMQRNINLKNPLVINDYNEINKLLKIPEKRDWSKQTSEIMSNKLQNLGYDGVIVKDYKKTGEPVFEYVVFNPDNIKP